MTFTWCIGPGLLFPWVVRHPIPISVVCGWYGGQKSWKNIERRIILHCYNAPIKLLPLQTLLLYFQPFLKS